MTGLLSPELIGVPPPARLDRATLLASAAAPSVPHALDGPMLVVGTDPTSLDGALRLAQLLARRNPVNVHVLGIVPPPPKRVATLTALDHHALEEGRRHNHRLAIRRQVHQTVGRPVQFSTAAEVGRVEDTVARVARARQSSLVLVGLEPRGSALRAASEQLALRSASAGGAPVIAVPVGSALLPRRTLVAMDFSEASMRAARAALAVTDAGGTVTLAHVSPAADSTDPAAAARQEASATESFRRLLLGDLVRPRGIALDAVILHGDPASVLLQFALDAGYDLVAMGLRASVDSRYRMAGSVCAGLLQGAMGSVLIAPPVEVDH